jgi:hypothetical protein
MMRQHIQTMMKLYVIVQPAHDEAAYTDNDDATWTVDRQCMMRLHGQTVHDGAAYRE